MPRRLLIAVLCALLVCLCFPSPGVTEDEPRFQMGFKLLADMIPEIAGPPLEEEHHNALNGDGLQMTARGLMVWRKADNWTAFTNGWWTWVNGPHGLQDRANYERFEWEGDAASFAAAPESQHALGPTVSSPLIVPQPQPTVFATGTAVIDMPAPTILVFAPAQQATATIAVDPTEVPIVDPTAAPAPTATRTFAPTQTPVPTTAPTQTPRPTNTIAPTATAKPANTVQPAPTVRPTATQPAGGVRSPEPAGNWVTSVYASTQYYCSRSSSYWQTWSASNRIWFQTEAALLAAYPNRTKHD